ncbi:hypothetical protein [Geothrix sp. PMB-07]|nr:hypothetical protein [Geothrix sp. PMB-07]WLT31568.1 hypothetical protein Q9293_17835 [Geothrix sp. PMB-07]
MNPPCGQSRIWSRTAAPHVMEQNRISRSGWIKVVALFLNLGVQGLMPL